MVTRLLTALLLQTIAANYALAGWSVIGSEHTQMRGQTIAAIGTVVEQSRYDPESYQQLKWFQFNDPLSDDFCFVQTGLPGLPGLPSLGGTPALVLVDKTKSVRVATIESVVGSIKVEVIEIRIIQCSSPY